METPGHLSIPLCPRSVAQDGNEFYVYVSIALFGVHDQHQIVRHRLWDMFSRLVWRTPLDDLLTPQALTVPAPGLSINSEDARPFVDACIAYLDLEQRAQADFAAVSENIRAYVSRQAAQSLTAPLDVVCPLVARVYQLGMVLYDSGRPTTPRDDAWHPTRTWHPPEGTIAPLRYVHLLQRRGSLQMLVNRGVPAEDARGLVPTRVVPMLPMELKTHYLFEPASSDAIAKCAVYHLDVFDSRTRRHLTVGPFVSPAARQDAQIQTLHYMRLDMSVNHNASYIFIIEGCQKVGPLLSSIPSCLTLRQTRAGRGAHPYLRVLLPGRFREQALCDPHRTLAG